MSESNTVWYVDHYYNIFAAEVVASTDKQKCLLVSGSLLVKDVKEVFADKGAAVFAALQQAQTEMDRASDRFRKVCKDVQAATKTEVAS